MNLILIATYMYSFHHSDQKWQQVRDMSFECSHGHITYVGRGGVVGLVISE